MSKPDRINYDMINHFFYDYTPFGTYKIINTSVNLFYDEIIKLNLPNVDNLIKIMTDNRIIDPSYFLENNQVNVIIQDKDLIQKLKLIALKLTN